MFAGFHEHLAVDQGVVIAGRALDVAARAAWKIVVVLRQAEAHVFQVDDVDVRELAFLQQSTVADAEQLSRLGGAALAASYGATSNAAPRVPPT